MNDIIVNITDQTRPITRTGFGKALILGVTAEIDGTKDEYKEYTSLTEIQEDYANTTEEYKAAKALLSQDPRPDVIAMLNVTRTTPDAVPADLTDALDEILEDNHNDWYWLMLTSKADEDIAAAAEWADLNKKMFITCFHSSTLADITGLATEINSDRTALFAHKQMSEYMDAALIGNLAPKSVGSWTAKFKTLIGISDAGYSTTEIASLEAANVNTYIKKMGILQTTEGKTTSGSYIDLTLSKDWLRAEMQTEIMRVLTNNEKVSYDETGISLIVGAVKAVLKRAVSQGIIAKDAAGNGLFTVIEPKLANISMENKSQRILPDVNWVATVAGAVHNVVVNGIVQV
jgi:hypothetical protein